MTLSRKVMDVVLKPFLVRMFMKAQDHFKEDIRPKYPVSKIIAHGCDAVIAAHQETGDPRLVKMWRGGRNSFIQVYENDSYYSRDMEIFFAAVAKHPEIMTAFKDIPVKLRTDIDMKESDYYG